MQHDHYPENYIRQILQESRVFAVVGASPKPIRPSFFVVKYLLAKGYCVLPVNPGHAGKTLLDAPIYSTLADIPEPVDVVDIFRNSEAALEVTKEAIAIGAKVVWMQLGVRNDEAAHLAEEAGLKVVMNRCPKIEYGRLSGEIGWAGVNTRTLSSQRPLMGAKGVQQLTLAKGRRAE